MMKLSEAEIQEYLLSEDRDPRLVAVVKRWCLLNEDQRHEIAKIMTRYVLSNQAGELLSTEKMIDGD
jgi:hypothetical protein